MIKQAAPALNRALNVKPGAPPSPVSRSMAPRMPWVTCLTSPPIDSALFNWVPGWIWIAIKTFCVVTVFLWVRATFPRFRYDQIMRLGWKIFIPVTLVWLVVVGLWIQSPWNIWK